MTDRRTEIIAKLENNLKHSISFFRSLSYDQLSVQLYTDGAKWTVKQVLAHFITIERSMHWLFKDILSGGSGSPDDFDLDRLNLISGNILKLNSLIASALNVRKSFILIFITKITAQQRHEHRKESCGPLTGYARR